jgi:hypothetical protein
MTQGAHPRIALKRLLCNRSRAQKDVAIWRPYPNRKHLLIRTTAKVSAEPIWTRIRVGANSREAAQTLCSRLPYRFH